MSWVGDLKGFLDEKVDLYNRYSFVAQDPISIPHRFSSKEDIEIAAFLACTLAWGNRKAIVKAGDDLIGRMDQDPYRFVIHATANDLKHLDRFVYRTFNAVDARCFVLSLRHIYLNHGGLESVLTGLGRDVRQNLIALRRIFFESGSGGRSSKHLADVGKGSSGKRLNMFLRWMVRKDQRGVDFGIWEKLQASDLYLPLDLHTGNVSRKLGLLHRCTNDWKAVEEVTQNLRQLDPSDPVKYDFALFGLGIFEKF